MFCNRKLIFKYLLQKQIIFQRLLFYSQSNLLCPHSCWNDRKFKFVIKQRIFQCPTKKSFFKGNKNTFKTFFFYSWQSQVRQRALRENKFNWQAANFWATFFLFLFFLSFFISVLWASSFYRDHRTALSLLIYDLVCDVALPLSFLSDILSFSFFFPTFLTHVFFLSFFWFWHFSYALSVFCVSTPLFLV